MSEKRLDAIHDTVHEMACDEARHGKACEGVYQSNGIQKTSVDLEHLLNTISDEEVLPLGGGLSNDQQRRIEDKIFAAMTGEKTKKKRFKKRMLFVLAAAIIAVFGLTVGAATQNDWDEALLNLMGVSSADSVQLEGGAVEVDISASCYGIDYTDNPEGEEKVINVTNVTSIGDKNNAYIRIDTDYMLPQGFDENRDYILPNDIDIEVRKSAAGDINPSGWASEFTSIYEDGKLSFVLNITGCENLNKSYVAIELEDLYLHHDLQYRETATNMEYPDEELIFAGTLQLAWQYSYKDNAKTTRMLKVVDANGTKVIIDKVTITPLDIHIHGYSTERVSAIVDNDMLQIEVITYKDGTTIAPEGISQGGVRDRYELDTHTNIEQIGQGLDVENIESITVHGEVIKVR